MLQGPVSGELLVFLVAVNSMVELAEARWHRALG